MLTEKKPEKLPDSRINTDFEDALKETITDEQIKVSDLRDFVTVTVNLV